MFPEDLRQAKGNTLRELQSQTGEELDALSSSPSPSASLRINSASGIPSVLRPSGGAFKGEL
jgi:hypothetical protein